jgi:hypothetical protein
MIARFKPRAIIDVEKISGWSSYKFYDATMIMNLKSNTPMIYAGEKRSRQIFHYAEPTPVYEGHIHTSVENLLTWQPTAFLITFAVLILSIAVWVLK